MTQHDIEVATAIFVGVCAILAIILVKWNNDQRHKP